MSRWQGRYFIRIQLYKASSDKTWFDHYDVVKTAFIMKEIILIVFPIPLFMINRGKLKKNPRNWLLASGVVVAPWKSLSSPFWSQIKFYISYIKITGLKLHYQQSKQKFNSNFWAQDRILLKYQYPNQTVQFSSCFGQYLGPR